VSPRIPTGTVVGSVFMMFLSRLGSLNALEQLRVSSLWKKWIGGKPPSADSLGRICARLDADGIRAVNQQLYARLKRIKGFNAPRHALIALVIDGHESNSSEKRSCSGCLQRRIQTKNGVKVVFYHRHVTALLVGRDFQLLIDAEPQRPGEDEVAAALRLVERVIEHYPRAFDVVVGDAAYADPRMYNLVLGRGKEILTVLKENQPTLLQEARVLLDLAKAQFSSSRSVQREIRDAGGFSMNDVDRPLRVVRAQEIRSVRRQLTGEHEEIVSDWFWVTSLPQERAGSCAVVELGHSRWAIENQGFNECVNRWHADHVYKHHPNALLALWLLCMVAFNLFQAFFCRNLKPEYRSRVTRQHVAELMRAELYKSLPLVAGKPP
jgi:hypothetical protein